MSEFNKKQIMPYVMVYKNVFPNISEILDSVKKSEEPEYTNLFMGPWKQWYDFGVKTELYTPGAQGEVDVDSLSEEQVPVFDKQVEIYNMVNQKIFEIENDYIKDWCDQDMMSEKQKEIVNSMDKVFAEYIDDWKVPPKNRKEEDKWLPTAIDVLKHNSETNRNYAIGYHNDNKGSESKAPGGKPIITTTIYLNDDYEGGGVSFLNQYVNTVINYKPEAGDVTVFPSFSPFFHAALPLSKNYKYFMRHFLTWNYPGSKEYNEGLNKYGKEIWDVIEENRIASEEASGIHFRNLIMPDEQAFDRRETFKYKESNNHAIPFFVREVIDIDGKTF
jgi:hypothetical protein